jgi:hypothetical protein
MGIQSSASDDCVRILTETGALFQETRERVHHLQEMLNEKAINQLKLARQACQQVWLRLAPRNPTAEVEQSVEGLKSLLASEQFVDSLDTIAKHTAVVFNAYKTAYLDLFDRRTETYQKAIEEIKNRPEWGPLSQTNKEVAETLLTPLHDRVGSSEDREGVAAAITLGNSSLAEMESDLAAVEALKSLVLVKLQELAYSGKGSTPVRRVRVSNLFNRPIQSMEDLDIALEQLRNELQKYIDEGAAIILE